MDEFNQRLLHITEWVYLEERTLIDKLTNEEHAEIGQYLIDGRLASIIDKIVTQIT